MDHNREAAEMGCSTDGLLSRRSPLVTYKRRKRDSTLARYCSVKLNVCFAGLQQWCLPKGFLPFNEAVRLSE